MQPLDRTGPIAEGSDRSSGGWAIDRRRFRRVLGRIVRSAYTYYCWFRACYACTSASRAHCRRRQSSLDRNSSTRHDYAITRVISRASIRRCKKGDSRRRACSGDPDGAAKKCPPPYTSPDDFLHRERAMTRKIFVPTTKFILYTYNTVHRENFPSSSGSTSATEKFFDFPRISTILDAPASIMIYCDLRLSDDLWIRGDPRSIWNCCLTILSYGSKIIVCLPESYV